MRLCEESFIEFVACEEMLWDISRSLSSHSIHFPPYSVRVIHISIFLCRPRLSSLLPGPFLKANFPPRMKRLSLLLPACRSELIEIEVSFLSLGAGAAAVAAAALWPFRPPPCVIPSIRPYFSHLGDFWCVFAAICCRRLALPRNTAEEKRNSGVFSIFFDLLAAT